MNILTFDEKYHDENIEYLDVLEKNLSDFNITLETNIVEALALYRSKDFNIVLIDFTTNNGKKFLQEVNRLNSLQKIITMGYTLSCSSEMGCEYCTEHFHKRRLIKPINPIELYKLIDQFNNIKCKYANKFENPIELLPEILKKYDYCKYDENNGIICIKNTTSHELKDFLNMINEFKDNGIEFKIIDEKNIKVMDG